MSDDLKPTDVRREDGTVERNGKVYGCHVDLMDGEKPDGCVAIEQSPSSCAFGELRAGRLRRSRWTCPHWKEASEADQ